MCNVHKTGWFQKQCAVHILLWVVILALFLNQFPELIIVLSFWYPFLTTVASLHTFYINFFYFCSRMPKYVLVKFSKCEYFTRENGSGGFEYICVWRYVLCHCLLYYIVLLQKEVEFFSLYSFEICMQWNQL